MHDDDVDHGDMNNLAASKRTPIGRAIAVTSVILSLGGVFALTAMGESGSLATSEAVYFATLGFGFGTLTWLLVGRQPNNGAVWALAWAALSAALVTSGLAAALLLSRQEFQGLTLDELRDLSPADLPVTAAIALHFRFWGVVPALWLPLTVGLLFFPDGRPPSPRWRWVGVFSIVAISVATVATASVHTPWSTLPVRSAEDSVAGTGGAIIDIAFMLSSVGAVLSVASLVFRYWRSTGATRSQIRWIGLGGFVFIATLIAGPQLEGVFGDTLVSDALGVLAFAALIVCWGVAITRYRLYDIDVVISKSVTYLGLAAAITALYAAVVVGPLLVIGATDDGGPGLLLPIVATAFVALLFEPIRNRMQRWANRLVYGNRSSPHEVLSQVTARLSDAPGSAGIDDLARLIADGTGADRAVVWMRSGESLRAEGRWSRDGLGSGMPLLTEDLVTDEFTEAVSVRHEEEELGALSISKPHNDPVTPADQELLADVAAGAALVLRNMRLNRDLEARADEVRASRRRLIAAQDAERHRLERDLHDGAQQQVVALKVKLGIAKTLAQREGADEIATRILGLAGETQDAVDSLRAVAHGIYPPLLESEGLERALRTIERSSSIPIAINASGLGRYDRSVEETAFFCVVETLERARMSGAASARVHLASRNGHLLIEVGVSNRTTEVDLTAVADRLDAAGGTLTIDGTPDHQNLRVASSLPAKSLELRAT